MGSVPSLPVLSQIRSFVQLCSGDAEGALRTQEEFVRKCVIVSQITSAVQAACGDNAAARDTQIQFLDEVNNLADGIPVIGHIKGSVHYACGDHLGGENAMKAASRTTGVVGGGMIGFIVGGPAGAFAGGLLGGSTIDGLTTGVHSAIRGEYTPSGTVAGWTEIGKNVQFVSLFDMAVVYGMDGLAGRAVGKAASKYMIKQKNTTLYRICNEPEYSASLKKQQILGARPEAVSEVWLSESNTHQKAWLTHGKNGKSLKVRVSNEVYKSFKENAIPQRSSGHINKARKAAGGRPKNITNAEQLTKHRQRKLNVCAKGPENLADLNKGITEIRPHNPLSLANTNGVTKAIARYVGPCAVPFQQTSRTVQGLFRREDEAFERYLENRAASMESSKRKLFLQNERKGHSSLVAKRFREDYEVDVDFERTLQQRAEAVAAGHPRAKFLQDERATHYHRGVNTTHDTPVARSANSKPRHAVSIVLRPRTGQVHDLFRREDEAFEQYLENRAASMESSKRKLFLQNERKGHSSLVAKRFREDYEVDVDFERTLQQRAEAVAAGHPRAKFLQDERATFYRRKMRVALENV